MLLALSLVALFVGPVLYQVFKARRHFYDGLDGFIVVVITGIVLWEMLPQALAQGAYWSLGLLALGFLGPTLLEKVFHHAERKVHTVALALGLAGLACHAAVDAIPLLELNGSGPMLALGVILHRIPVGLMLWWLIAPKFGNRMAFFSLLILASATVGGYMLGQEWAAALSGGQLIWFQAFVAGSILHVVFHRPHAHHHHHHDHTREFKLSRYVEGMGNLAGIALLVVLVLLHGEGEESVHAFYHNTSEVFWGLARESAPALLLAYLVGGLVSSFMPAASVRWMGRGKPLQQAARGVAIGLPLPICTCGVLPLYQTLIKRGAPPSAAMAFLIATPELGIDAFLISLPLLGQDMAFVRLAAAGIIALAVGWGVGWFTIRTTDASAVLGINGTNSSNQNQASVSVRVREGLSNGFGKLVDDTAPWILAGLLIAALAQPLLEQGWLQTLPDSVEILFFALLGLPIYVCASGATPIVAVLLMTGVSPGAALAFLLTGPATNISTYGILSKLHSRKVALVFGAATTVVAILLGIALNTWFANIETLGPEAIEQEIVPMWEYLALAVLMLIFVASMVRRGARAFMGEVFSGFAPHSHDHDDEPHGCSHETCTCANGTVAEDLEEVT